LEKTSPSKIDLVIQAREKDLGGFSVRRALPYATHRMVGPFIFFDHMGPAIFDPGHGIDVRPHPHINLATVTYLFEGRIHHRDSLGSDQVIEPGAINWMIAGRGIVHSERSMEPERSQGGRLNGIQLWVALPEEFEEIPPSFSHHGKETLPRFKQKEISLKLLLGSCMGEKSPVPVHSDLFYLEAQIPRGNSFIFPSEGQEVAAYVVEGTASVENKELGPYSMLIAKRGEGVELTACTDCKVMFLGGQPLGPRFIEWNFVSSSAQRIAEAKAEWSGGPRAESSRFQPILGDHQEFIPLPEDTINK